MSGSGSDWSIGCAWPRFLCGNQQKVEVAKSPAQEPSLVFLDEPPRRRRYHSRIHARIRRLAEDVKLRW
jgi:ABC-type sugar transport system ATPase subunit